MDKRITKSHGGGGNDMRTLIKELFLAHFVHPELAKLNDFARLDFPGGDLAVTTDSFVVDPWEFPGGNIGDLAVCGTVNDLSMSGARPLYLTAGFILPEGFPYSDLETIVKSMAHRAAEAGVAIVTGDTKVVEAGSGPFINTAGVGAIPEGLRVAGDMAKPGDAVILTGPIGNHGIAVMSRREGFGFGTEVVSDVAPLSNLVGALVDNGLDLHVLRDPTRGGIAEALNEIADQSVVEIEIEEENLIIDQGVRAGCDLMGYDPLHIANEGCALVVLPQIEVDRALEILKDCDYGGNATVIGRVAEVDKGPRVVARTPLGGRRLVDPPTGNLLPRIC